MLDPVGFIESKYHIVLKRASRDEYTGPCPLDCGGQGTDRFHVWADTGNYWCRVCGAKGWVDVLSGERLSAEELRLRKIEVDQARLERRQAEQEQRLSALERMAKCTDHLRYHEQVAQALDYWFREGMTQETIDRYLLGYCDHCPAYRESASYTIPVVNGGRLENIRHRLQVPNGGKYRPHIAGLGASLFNADVLEGAQKIILTEGEKKAMISTQSGFPAVGILGKRTWKREWLDLFSAVQVVYIALDPDATESAETLARIFDGRGRVVDLPAKLDDMIVRFGAGTDDIKGFLQTARPICSAN